MLFTYAMGMFIGKLGWLAMVFRPLLSTEKIEFLPSRARCSTNPAEWWAWRYLLGINTVPCVWVGKGLPLSLEGRVRRFNAQDEVFRVGLSCIVVWKGKTSATASGWQSMG